ncbi:MAG: PHP domain-containing protein [bacterium]|nr:PHP domain-containing protein [bacterium]
MQKETLGKADLHIHTKASDGIVPDEELVDFLEHQTDLDVIAITDHNTLEGAKRIVELARKKKVRFEVIMGEEISSLDGHIIGLFLTERIVKGMSAADTVEAIHAQGGLAILAHPERHVTRKHATHILKTVPFDGLEIGSLFDYDPHYIEFWDTMNQSTFHKAAIASTDAHLLDFFNRCHTLFPGKTAKEFHAAMKYRRTEAVYARPFTYWEKRRIEAKFVWGHKGELEYVPIFLSDAARYFVKDFLR